MKRKKRTLLRIILVPALIVVLLQGLLPFLTVVFSGVKKSLEDNTIQMDNHLVENSKVILENDMIENWRSVYKESDMLTMVLSSMLQENGVDITEFLGDSELQQRYLEGVFSNLVYVLQYNET